MVMPSSSAARLATRLSFFVAGVCMASWAPLVPFAKARLGVDDGTMGMMLLCLGLGSVLTMSLTGMLCARYGSRILVIVNGLVVVGVLPLLAIASSEAALGLSLFVFGAGIGSLDVAMNIHAVDVERASGRPMMSGFHALYSIGGFAGSSSVTAMLSLGFPPIIVAMNAVLMLATIVVIAPRLIRSKAEAPGPLLAVPSGVVLLLSMIAFATFLTEGAMLDWSALLISTDRLAPISQSGIGYMLFAIAMTAGRFAGDSIVARIGDRNAVRGGGLLAVGGFAVLLTAPVPAIAFSGFILIGLGASNIVPVLYRLTGAQTAMPSALAVSALSTIGYAGILIGPAGIGAVAHVVGLHDAFWILACLIASGPLLANHVTANVKRAFVAHS